MKTAVSIPDPIFREAEREAKRRKWPRSRLYAAALQAFLRKREADRVTEKLNEVYRTEDSRIPEEMERAQFENLEPEKW